MSEDEKAYDGKYKRIRRSDYKVAPALRWVIKDVLPVGATLTLVGDPKCGKTLVALSMALAATLGKTWCSLPVRKCRTLYVSPEDFNGLIRRQMAWEAVHNGGEPVDLDFFNVPINLTKLDSLKEAFEGIKAQGMEPEFIVLDTLARSTMGASENDEDAMTEAFFNLEAFKESIGNPLVLIPHHNNRGHNYRGSTAIDATPDGMLGLRTEGDYSVLSSISMRMSGGFNSMKLSFEERPVLTEDGWQLERTLSGLASTMQDAIAANEPLDTDAEGSRVRKIIVDECRRLKWPKHSVLEEACKEMGVTKAKFDKHMKYLEGVGRLVKEDDRDDKRVKHYRVWEGAGEVYRDTGEGDKKVGIGILVLPPKGGVIPNTEYSNTEYSNTNTNTDTESDKTGTLNPTTSSGTIPNAPLQTEDHANAFTALKELTDGPAPEPSRKAGPQ